MSTRAAAPTNWAELLGQVADEGAADGVRSADSLENLLRIWCESAGVEGAALYLAEPVATRAALFGTVSFPETLEPSTEDGFGRVDLGRAALLFSPLGKAADKTVGPMELLLSQGSEIHRLRESMRRQHFQDSYRRVELEAIYEVGLAIASTLDLDQLSEGILQRAVSLCDARVGALYLLEDEQLKLRGTIGGDARPLLKKDGRRVQELLAATDRVEQDVLPGAGYPLAVPIDIDGKLRGLLAVADKESREGVGPFEEADRRTLGLFATQAAIALENARLHQQALEKERLEREMELAAEIQQRLLPKGTPTLPGFELAGWNRPARQVGGDYYGFLSLGGGRVGLVVADVTGKGMPAALLVSTLHSALRLLLDGSELAPPLFSQLNEHIVDSSSPNKFITLILVEVDPSTAALRYLNAGHNPGLLVQDNGRVVELPAGGMPLGLRGGSRYDSRGLQINPGDLLCLYSDGITECESGEEEEFGLERLREILCREKTQPLPAIAQAIDRATREFAQDRPQGDDQTLVLLRRCG